MPKSNPIADIFYGRPLGQKDQSEQNQIPKPAIQDRVFLKEEEGGYYGGNVPVHERIPNALDATVDVKYPTLPHVIPGLYSKQNPFLKEFV